VRASSPLNEEDRLSSPRVDPSHTIAAIVLAAGMSRRMGRHKPLLPIGDRTMIAHVVDGFLSADVASIHVVTGFDAANVMAALGTRDAIQVHNPNYFDGMLSSVKCGVRAVRNVRAFFISLGDQPFILPSTLRDMETNASRAPIVRPSCRGRHGHPLLIGSHLADEILALGSHETLNDFMKRHADQIHEIDIDDPGVVEDIDTPEDYARALARKGELCPTPTPAGG
jgi:CTP:molybdopterin cytidylyltransferase MocA